MSDLAQRPDLARAFAEDGYVVLRPDALVAATAALRERFEERFLERFGTDPQANRNLIKRFGDGLDVARVFASPELEAAARELGLLDPVFCGPVVTHYTSHDHTGSSYGLPFHQDWPSMASSDRGAIFWLTLTESGPDSHGLEVVPGAHATGLLAGRQEAHGYVLDHQDFADSKILEAQPGNIVVMSPFLPHRTFVNPAFRGWKLSLSRRMDDLACPVWPDRGFANAYGTSVDRDLFRRSP